MLGRVDIDSDEEAAKTEKAYEDIAANLENLKVL